MSGRSCDDRLLGNEDEDSVGTCGWENVAWQGVSLL